MVNFVIVKFCFFGGIFLVKLPVVSLGQQPVGLIPVLPGVELVHPAGLRAGDAAAEADAALQALRALKNWVFFNEGEAQTMEQYGLLLLLFLLLLLLLLLLSVHVFVFCCCRYFFPALARHFGQNSYFFYIIEGCTCAKFHDSVISATVVFVREMCVLVNFLTTN